MTGDLDMVPDPRVVLSEKVSAESAQMDNDELALRYAALSGPFLPDNALIAAKIENAGTLAKLAVISKLSQACDSQIWAPHWIMRAAARRRYLEANASRVGELLEWRVDQIDYDGGHYGPVARTICDAIAGVGVFAPEAVDAALAAPATSVNQVEQLIRGLSFAQPLAPASSRLDALRAWLARANAEANSELLRYGVYGRDDQLEAAEAFLGECWERPHSLRLLFIGGIGGIGKSTLMAEIRRRARDRHRAICVTFDFDRPGIDGSDPLGLSLDLARQVSEAVGVAAASLYRDRVDSIKDSSDGIERRISETVDGGDDRTRVARLNERLAKVIRASDQPLLLMLDTLESLILRGDSAAFGLVEWLRDLSKYVPKLAVLGAGRGDLHRDLLPLANSPIELKGLDDRSAHQLIERLGVQGELAEELTLLAKGNPLVLRLGARLLLADPEALRQGEINPALQADLLAGQLYRLILSRIDVPAVRTIAHPGLLLRRLCPELVRDVLGPEISVDGIAIEEASDLLDQLKRYGWLVSEDAKGWLTHRQDLRGVLLELQIKDDPARSKRLFAAAAKWHDRHGDRLMALYYRLQGLRWRRTQIAIDPELAGAFNRDMIEELPPVGRDQIAFARGERSTQLRSDDGVQASQGTAQPRVALTTGHALEIQGLLLRRNRTEAALMVSRAEDFDQIDPRSDLGAAVIEALWQAGQWGPARKLLSQRWRSHPATEKAESLAIVAAAADLMPVDLRKWLRRDATHASLIADLVDRADPLDPDLDVVALLLWAEGYPVRQGFAQAAVRLWSGQPLEETNLQAFRPASPDKSAHEADQSLAPHDRLIARLMPDALHREILINMSRQPAWLACQKTSDALAMATGRGLLGAAASAEAIDRFRGPYGLSEIDALGALAHWSASLALVEPGLRLKPVVKAIVARALAAQGIWTYGDCPDGWIQPPAPRRAIIAVETLLAGGSLDGAAAVAAARSRWLGSEDPAVARLSRKCADIVRSARKPLLAEALGAALTTTNELLAALVPMELAPVLAVEASAPIVGNSAPMPLPPPIPL